MTQKPKGYQSNIETPSTDAVADKAKQKVGEVVNQAKQSMSDVTDQAQEQITSKLTSQKDQATQGLSAVSQALRQASDDLDAQEQAMAKQYIDMAAMGVEKVSNYLESSDIRTMVSDVEDFARSQPALFLAGAFVLGAFGARFLKSSKPASAEYAPAYRGNYTPRPSYGTSFTATSRGYSSGNPAYNNPSPSRSYEPSGSAYRTAQEGTVNSNRYNPVDYTWSKQSGDNI